MALRISSVLIVVMVVVASSVSHAADIIRFATAIIPPYQYQNSDGDLKGVALPIVECAMRSLGQDYSVSVLPWLRAQGNVQLGESDAFFVASNNADRNSYATMSEPLFSGKRSWYFRPGYHIETDSDEFKKTAIVGTVFGTNMHAWLKGSFSQVIAKDSLSELISLLTAKRLDALLTTDLMYSHTMKKLNLPEDKFSRSLSQTKPLGVYFGHHFIEKNASFLASFNQTLVDCRTLQ